MKAGRTRVREGPLSALRTPTNPPAPTMLVPLDASPLNALREGVALCLADVQLG